VKCHIVERKNGLHPTVWRHLPEFTGNDKNAMQTDASRWIRHRPYQGFNRRHPREQYLQSENTKKSLLDLVHTLCSQSPILPIIFWEDDGNQHAGIKNLMIIQ
jgi:hypothetical protein